MKKTLKSIQKKHGMLNEAYAWERTSGGALPTLSDVQAKYNAKPVNEQEKQSLNEGTPLAEYTWTEFSEMMNKAAKENTILKFEWTGFEYPLNVSLKDPDGNSAGERNMAIAITGM